MAIALDAGYLDTLVTGTHVLEYDVELKAQVGSGNPSFDDLDGTPALARVETSATSALFGRTDLGAGVDSAADIDIILTYGSPLTTVVLFSGHGTATGDPGYIAHKVRCKKTIGPLRLGVAYSSTGVLGYAWFEDGATTITWEVDGITGLAESFSPTYVLNVSAGEILGFGVNQTVPSTYPTAKFSGWLFNAATIVHTALEMGATARKYIGPTYQWTIDLQMVGPDGAAITGADAGYSGARAVPSAFTRTVYQFAEDAADLPFIQRAGAAVLADPWLTAQTIRPPASQWGFISEAMAPKSPGNAAVTSWNAGTVRLTSPLAVLLSTNAFVAAGSLVVSGPANTPTFTVSATGAGATKSLRSHWRNWNNPANPDGLYQAGDQYTATKRSAYAVDANTPDVWGWGFYAYLDVDFTVPSASTLTVTLTWAVIREDQSVVTFTRAYTKTWAASGMQRLDLLFPDAGDRPFFGERVDSVQISGFNTGVYTLNAMQLVADQDGYLKYGSRTLGDWGGVTLAQDGQLVHAHWNGDSIVSGDDLDLDGREDRTKDHQNGIFAYASSEGDVESVESLGGAFGMGQSEYLLADLFAELHRLEGMTATYDGAAIDAALTDTFGNTITSRRVAWLLPNLPHTRLPKNTNVTLSARLVASDVEFPGGLGAAGMVIFQRQRLGAVAEAQALTTALARAGAGSTIQARIYLGGGPGGGDASVGSAVTDAGGFVTIPHRTGLYNNAGSYEEFSLYLE